jgi:hypothetical protein
MDNNLHNELKAAEVRRADITETIHNLGAEGARLDQRITVLRAEIARADTQHVPCWNCSAPQARDIQHGLANHGRSMRWSPGGLPQDCCRIMTFQSRNTSIGIV